MVVRTCGFWARTLRAARQLRMLTLLVGLGGILFSAGCGVEATVAPTATPAPTATITPTHTATPVPTPTPTSNPTTTVRPTSTLQPTSTATATFTPRPRPTAPSAEELAAQYPELAPILNNPEVSSVYKELVVAYEEGGQQAAAAKARERGLVSPEGDVRATLILDTTDIASTVTQLQSMGIEVLETDAQQVQIAVPPELMMAGANEPGPFLNRLAGLEHVTGVRPPY